MLPQISYTRGYLTGRALLHGKQKQKPYPLSTFGLSVYYSILNFRVKTFYFCFFLTFIKKQKQKQNKTSNQPTEKSTMFWLWQPLNPLWESLPILPSLQAPFTHRWEAGQGFHISPDGFWGDAGLFCKFHCWWSRWQVFSGSFSWTCGCKRSARTAES